MNEVITGMRVIKMYGWEEAFQKMITQLRKLVTAIVCISSEAAYKVATSTKTLFCSYMKTPL